MSTRRREYALVRLSDLLRTSSLPSIRSAFWAAAKAENVHYILDLEGADADSTETVSAMISILRSVRQFGGEVRVVTSEHRIRRMLGITGLDKLFCIFDSLDVAKSETDCPGRPRSTVARQPGIPSRVLQIVRRSIGLMFVILALGLSPLQAASDNAPDAAAIVNEMNLRNPGLHTYMSHVHITIRMHSFPFLSPVLDGTAYFEQPDKYMVVFSRVPFYAKGFQKLYADIGNPATWGKRFVITFEGQQRFDGRLDNVLRLVLRKRGMIDHELVYVDPRTLHLDAMSWYYYNGGVISMTQTYRRYGLYDVVAAQDATIRIPHIRATAHATYDDYRTNVALDGSPF